jgi:hypothetical protein
MRKFLQIAHTSLISTSLHKRWWILALLQIMSLSAVFPVIVRPRLLLSPFILYLPVSLVIFVPVTVWLWLDIDARKSQDFRQKTLKVFLSICASTAGIVMVAALLTFVARIGLGERIFFVAASSVVAATGALAMLFAVLCGQGFRYSLILALDTWSKKVSLAAIIAFILILSQAFVFALIQGFWRGSRMDEGFEVLNSSATIWLLLLALTLLASFLSAFVNCLLVHLFLDNIRFKKDQDLKEEAIAKRIILEPNP